MRFGVCSKLENLLPVKDAGYDYFEWNLSRLAGLSQPEFEDARAAFEEAGLPVETCAIFFPREYRLTGDVDLEALAAYAEKALARAAKLGVGIVVLGNGKLRSIPEGFPRERAVEQFKEVLRLCGDIAGGHRIKIALEPLNFSETNLINTVAEGLALCRELNHPHVGLLVDFYHMHMVGEPVEDLEQAGEWLIHAHIARPHESRLAPIEKDRETCLRWAAALKKCGYNGRLTLEMGSSSDFEAEIQTMIRMSEVFR